MTERCKKEDTYYKSGIPTIENKVADYQQHQMTAPGSSSSFDRSPRHAAREETVGRAAPLTGSQQRSV